MRSASRSRIRTQVVGTTVFTGLLALAGLLPLGGSAHAQMTTSGMCSGMGGTGTGMWTIAGTANLSVDDITILGGSGSPFGRAECECRSRDIMMRIQLSTPIMQALGASVAETVWMGAADCSQSTNRTMTNTQCEQVTEGSPAGSTTKIDTSAFTSTGQFYISIPAESLINPKPVNVAGNWSYICDPGFTATPPDINKGPGSQNQSRTAYVVVGDNQSSAGCNVPIVVNMTPPQQPTQVGVSSGDGALSVSWTIPQGAASIENYQILCRKKAEPTVPVTSDDFRSNTLYWFSSCISGTLYRRPMPGVMANKQVAPPAGVVYPPASTEPVLPFPIDPAFICSDRIAANGSSLEQRVEGLENGVEYEVMVVSIDYFGNPSASDVAVGVPLPTLSPLQRFCDANGGSCPTGFGCEATQRRGSNTTGAMTFLAALGLLAVLRRVRRQRLAPISSRETRRDQAGREDGASC